MLGEGASDCRRPRGYSSGWKEKEKNFLREVKMKIIFFVRVKSKISDSPFPLESRVQKSLSQRV